MKKLLLAAFLVAGCSCAHQGHKPLKSPDAMAVCRQDRHDPDELECMDFEVFMRRFLPAIGCDVIPAEE